MIRTLIVDDEPIARRRIHRLLTAETDIEILNECGSGLEALPLIDEQAPDLLLLDVQMPEMDGMELLQNLKRPMPCVIFTTAFDRYAVRAFDLHAADYLLKPIDEDRFRRALDRARTQIRQKRQTTQDTRMLEWLAGLQKEKHPPLDRLVIKQPGRAFFLKVESIDWLEAADNYVRVHAGSETHLIRDTIGSFEAKLDPRKFARIHRSTIVNIDRVKEVQSFFQGNQIAVLMNGQKLKLSRSYRHRLDFAPRS